MAAPTVLKVHWQAQTFRVRINGNITYSSLERSVRQALPDFPLKASLKYRDEEGDACTFCEATLPDFLAVAREGNVLRLEVGGVPVLTCAEDTVKDGPEYHDDVPVLTCAEDTVKDGPEFHDDVPVLTCAEETVKDGPEYHDIHTPPAPSEAPAAAGSELQTLGSGISAAAPAQGACSGACGFARTWHPTHCCRACQKGKGHGPRCDKIKVDVPVQGATEPVHTAAAARFNFSFPVHVEDGRRLTIQWRKGDAPALVATTFAQEHCIGSDELAVIEAFVAHASAVAQDSQAGTDALRQEEEEEVAKAAQLQKEAAAQAEAKAAMEATRATKLKEEKEKKEAAEAEAKATREAADAADLRVKEAIGAAEAATEAAKAAKLQEREAAKVLKEAIKAAEVLKKKAARAAAMVAKLQEKEAHKEAAKAAKLQEKEAAKVEAKAVKLQEKEAAKAAKLQEKEAARAAKLQGKEAAKEAAQTAKLQENEAARIAALEDEVAATAAAEQEVACTEACCGDEETKIPQEFPTTESGCGAEETSSPEEVGFPEGCHGAMEKELPREDAAEAVGEGPSPKEAADAVGEVRAEVPEPPAALEAFEEQLELLQSMGFGEHDAGVLRAILEMNGGEMARTIDALLG